MTKPVINAMIPARAGSERLKFKNLRMLCGKPVISYAIDAAQQSGVFDQVMVNSEHPVFGRLAERHAIGFHQRPTALGSSEARSDDVVADFMAAVPGDVLVWVNPIAPLQTPEEIREVVQYFVDNKYDSLITVKDEQVHCLYHGRPLNYSEDGLFAKTQDLEPVQAMVYSLMMWRYDTFMQQYREKGYALLSGRVGYYPVHRHSTIILKYEEDLRIAEAVLTARRSEDEGLYDPLVDEILGARG